LTSGLNSTDICDIIRTAGAAGVKHLAFGGLEMVFGGEVTLTPESMLYRVENNQEVVDNSTEEVKTENSTEIDLEELALSDPLQYEKLMYGGE